MVKVSGLRPGDLVAHHSECIHMAGNNRSDDQTRVGYLHNQIPLNQQLLRLCSGLCVVIAGKQVRDPGVCACARVCVCVLCVRACLVFALLSSEHLRACFGEFTRHLMRKDTQDI